MSIRCGSPTDLKQITAIRLEVFPDDRLPAPRTGPGLIMRDHSATSS